jgi:hypothetical protein
MMRVALMRRFHAERLYAPRFTLRGWFDEVRRTSIIAVIAVVSCGVFAAHAAAALVAAGYLAPGTEATPRPGLVARPVEPVPPGGHHRPGGGQLVERNMFCSSCTPVAGAAAGNDLVLPPAVLIETSFGGEPRATVHVLASEVQGSWGIGDTIPGLGRLDRIAPRWIELVDPAGHRGRLSLLGLAPAASRGSDTAMSESPAPAAPWSTRIKQLDEQNYEIDRDLVRELVTGAARPGGMRFVPKLDHGAVNGVRVFGVTPGSIPFALGLHNGDTLEAIDGAPLKDLNQLLELYARLDQLSAVELTGTRAGKPLVRTLRLR